MKKGAKKIKPKEKKEEKIVEIKKDESELEEEIKETEEEFQGEKLKNFLAPTSKSKTPSLEKVAETETPVATPRRRANSEDEEKLDIKYSNINYEDEEKKYSQAENYQTQENVMSPTFVRKAPEQWSEGFSPISFQDGLKLKTQNPFLRQSNSREYNSRTEGEIIEDLQGEHMKKKYR